MLGFAISFAKMTSELISTCKAGGKPSTRLPPGGLVERYNKSKKQSERNRTYERANEYTSERTQEPSNERAKYRTNKHANERAREQAEIE